MFQKKQVREELHECAHLFFDNLLNCKIKNGGISLKEISKFDVFPRIISNHGISAEKLLELAGGEGIFADIIYYHITTNVQQLESLGLVKEDKSGHVFVTAKGIRFSSFLENRHEVNKWLDAETNNAEAQGVDMSIFNKNVGYVRSIISRMSSRRREAFNEIMRTESE